MKKHHVALLLLLLGFYLLFGLGGYGLFDNNEGLYAEVAREMVETKSFIIPHLDGVPYLEKPPLLYWLVALMYAVFGQTAFAARLAPMLGAAAAILSLVWLGHKTGEKQAGLLSALILGSSFGFIGMSRVLLFDMVLCGLLSWALVLFFARLESGRAGYLRWSYVFLALAVLTKGPVALVLYGLITAAYLLAVRRTGLRGLARVLFDPAALALFFAVAAPWHVLAALRDRDFAWYYFINEQVLRFLHLRKPVDYYTGPWYYYLPRIAAGLFPWSAFLPLLARRRPKGDGRKSADPGSFLRLWFLMPLLFFSASLAKGNYYMIVAVPPLAFLLAEKINRLIEEERLKGLQFLAGLIPLVCIAAVAALAPQARDSDRLTRLFGDRTTFGLYFILFVSLSVVAVALLHLRRPMDGLFALAMTGLPALLLFLHLTSRSEAMVSSREMAEVLRASTEARQVFFYRDFEDISALPFYLRRPVRLIDSASNDLYFGIAHAGPTSRFPAVTTFIRESRHEKVFVVVMEKRLREFQPVASAARLAAVRVIGRTVLFGNKHAELAWRAGPETPAPPGRRITSGG